MVSFHCRSATNDLSHTDLPPTHWAICHYTWSRVERNFGKNWNYCVFTPYSRTAFTQTLRADYILGMLIDISFNIFCLFV